MDGRKDTSHVANGQGALRKRRYKKKDGSLAIVVELQPKVFEFGRLVLLPRRTVLDGYQDAIGRARARLRAGLAAGDAHNALAAFEAAQDAALALLREAFGIVSALDDYLAAGMAIFPVNARGAPLTQHGVKDASSDPEVIRAWRERWPGCDFGWAVPADVVVVDLDEKHGKHGLRDFRERAGCDPHDVATPQATTPSGGLHLVYRATKPYKNLAPAIPGTGVDTRTAGGYVVAALEGNGRAWLRPLIGGDGVMAPLLPAPAWLNCALRREPSPRAPLVLAPRSALAPPSADPWAQRKALGELEKACAREIRTAPAGAQDATRHAQCFYIGGIIARGDIGYEEAYAALLEAALAMPVYRDPWRGLETKVARSIEAGMGAPLPLPPNEQWVRDFRARMQARLTQMKEARRG